MVAGQSVQALGQPEPNDHRDGDLGRLLGAFPTAELLMLLDLDVQTLLNAIKKYMSQSGNPQPWLVQGTEQQVLEDLERASVGGLTLKDLEALRLAVTPDSLVYWPRARLEALLWEATAKLLRVSQENHALAFLVQSLTSALPSLPDSVQELEQPPQESKKGLLSRLASAFRPAPETARDWPRRWEKLARWIQDELVREVQHYVSPLPALLNTVALALDLSRPDPIGPEPQLSEAVPEGTNEQQQHARAIALYSQQMRSRASLIPILTMRRRVQGALAERE